MRFDTDALGLSLTGKHLLRDLVHERTGLYYDDARCNQLLDKLAPLVIERGFDSFLDYYYLLRYDPAAGPEWDRVLDALAVPETYFWREPDQLRALADALMPALAQAGNGVVRIWSVPCSSGEEPLSIAMALDEAGWFDRAHVEIFASDASREAIEKARAGCYGKRSFRNLPPPLRSRYFTQQAAETWQVRPDLHARVKWSVVNIMDPGQAGLLAGSPVVFCRNLLIYFSDQTLRRTVDLFADHMPTPGYLCLGTSESLLRHTTRFALEEIGGAYIYVKR